MPTRMDPASAASRAALTTGWSIWKSVTRKCCPKTIRSKPRVRASRTSAMVSAKRSTGSADGGCWLVMRRPKRTGLPVGVLTRLGDDRDLDRDGRVLGGERLADGVQAEAVGHQRPGVHRTVPEQAHGLGELVLIDHRAEDRQLAPDDPEEMNPRRLVGKPGQDHSAAGTRELERR